ncbi:MAG: sigma-54-dependent Fis family transcriptional regulator [Deltaproteobacteria bacterium]|nr:sigma-54-dependent Fis family transcriptional regulator [Deltaproteobacteria bacterium]
MSASNALSPNLLVIEDDPSAAFLMTEALTAIGVRPVHVSTCREAYRALHLREFACVVIDLGLPDGSGHDIQQTILRGVNPPPVVFVTADEQAESAIQVLQAGASEYVIKRPEYLERLRSAVLKIVDRPEEVRSLERIDRESRTREPANKSLVGSCRQMREVRARIERCRDRDVPVLITGETGTGKELVARAIHDTGSRAGEPFVAVNCAAITGSLFESELFGSIRGAFTGATRDRAGLFGAAGRGTILLDEIGELPLDAQAKLLRVLEDRSYRAVGDTREVKSNARVIVATNRNLSEEVEQGSFREDLFYRLDVMSIAIPPLRERPTDLPKLVEHFLRIEAGDFGPRRATAAALDRLRVHAWPGNVRELRHAITRTLLWTDEVEIERFEIRPSGKSPDAPHNRRGLGWNEVAEALREHTGRLQPSAKALQVSVRTLQRRMRDLEMNIRDFR